MVTLDEKERDERIVQSQAGKREWAHQGVMDAYFEEGFRKSFGERIEKIIQGVTEEGWDESSVKALRVSLEESLEAEFITALERNRAKRSKKEIEQN